MVISSLDCVVSWTKTKPVVVFTRAVELFSLVLVDVFGGFDRMCVVGKNLFVDVPGKKLRKSVNVVLSVIL